MNDKKGEGKRQARSCERNKLYPGVFVITFNSQKMHNPSVLNFNAQMYQKNKQNVVVFLK